jgi:RNA polymerase sigma factor (sigma-70 family)
MDTERKLTTEESKLIRDHVGLAQHFYWQYLNRFQQSLDFSIDQEELLSQAYLGLIRAAKRYRAYGEEHRYSEESIASGKYFVPFAKKSIIGQMIDSLRKLDHVHTLVRKDYKSLVALGYSSGGNLSHDELSERSGLSSARVQKVITSVESRPVSMNAMHDMGNHVEDVYSTDYDVESSAVVSSVQAALVETIDKLPKLQQVVIAMKYYSELDFFVIAKEVGVSVAKVRAAHSKALLKIHTAMANAATDS